MVVGQNQRDHFGVIRHSPPFFFGGEWDVHWGYGLLTHGHMGMNLDKAGRFWNAPIWGVKDLLLRCFLVKQY